MRLSNIAATINASIVLLWLLSTSDTIGTPHEQFYFDLPIAFLIVPVAVVAFNYWLRRRVPASLDELASGLLGIAIVANLCGFGWYAMMSGGGV